MSGFVRLAEGILFWQVQETGSRVSEGIFTEAVFLGISVLVGRSEEHTSELQSHA